MDNKLYGIEELKEVFNDAIGSLGRYGVMIINDDYHACIIIDVLNAEIKRLEAVEKTNLK